MVIVEVVIDWSIWIFYVLIWILNIINLPFEEMSDDFKDYNSDSIESIINNDSLELYMLFELIVNLLAISTLFSDICWNLSHYN